MRRPSGDQAGDESTASLWVRRVTPEPSAFITYTSKFPSRSEENAMRRPSGDQSGPESKASWTVRRVAGAGVGATTTTGPVGERSDLPAAPGRPP